jgi:hypothetical protein
MRSLRLETKFHHMWRGASSGAPPTTTRRTARAADSAAPARTQHRHLPLRHTAPSTLASHAVDRIDRELGCQRGKFHAVPPAGSATSR